MIRLLRYLDSFYKFRGTTKNTSSYNMAHAYLCKVQSLLDTNPIVDKKILKDLQYELAELSSHSLTAHEERTCQEALKALRKAQPKEKKTFAFKTSQKKKKGLEENKPLVQASKPVEQPLADIENLTNQARYDVLPSSKSTLWVDNCVDSCVVISATNLLSLKLTNLTRCVVVVHHPIQGPVFADKCEACTVHVLAQQMRLHSLSTCRVFTSGSAIIEFCSEMLFGPWLQVGQGGGQIELEEGKQEKEGQEGEKKDYKGVGGPVQVQDFGDLFGSVQTKSWGVVSDVLVEEEKKRVEDLFRSGGNHA